MNLQHPDSRRRTFLKQAAALPLLWAVDRSSERIQAQSAGAEQVLPGLRLMRNSVNSALFERNGKKLLIDSGEITDSPGGGIVDWALFTHHHRDQCSSVSRLARKGTKVAVPAREKLFFEEAHRFWDSADNILDHRYDFRPHLFTLRDPVQVARALQGGDVHEWEGLKLRVLDTPGHTEGSVTYLVEVAGRRVAFTGDLICGPGQMWEIYSLQKRFPGMMKVQVTLNLPEGWTSDRRAGETQIAARAEGRVRLQATAPSSPDRRRHILGLSTVIDGRSAGEFAEAIINFLG